jgi:hypothetical protein
VLPDPATLAAADLEGTRFAFAALTTADEQSLLRIVATGMPPLPVVTGRLSRIRDRHRGLGNAGHLRT